MRGQEDHWLTMAMRGEEDDQKDGKKRWVILSAKKDSFWKKENDQHPSAYP